MKKSIIEDWKYRGLTWQEITRKYKVSKAWFYRLRKRYIEFGEKELDNLIRKKAVMPHALGYDQKVRILEYVLFL